jgi:hypothetical protein
MVHLPEAQGPLGETAKYGEARPRFAFLRGPSLDKDLSCNPPLLVCRAPPLPVDEDPRP